MDYAPFARKYVQDMYDWQKKDGKLPQIAPCGGVDFYMDCMNGSVGWADAGVLIPYRFWKLYGDDSLIRKHYIGLARYARFMIGRCGKFTPLRHHLSLKGEAKKYIVNCGQSYGEWAEPAEVFPNDWTNVVLPHPEESTAYTSFIMGHMVEIADYLGKAEDKALFEEYRDGCKEAYRQLVTLPGYELDTDRQAKLVRPLYMHLLDKKQTDYAEKRLVKAMENYGWVLVSSPPPSFWMCWQVWTWNTPTGCWKTRKCPAGSSCRRTEPPPSGNPGKARRPRTASPL